MGDLIGGRDLGDDHLNRQPGRYAHGGIESIDAARARYAGAKAEVHIREIG